MTDERHSGDERPALAAEHALRLLSGHEQRRAAQLEADDSDFADEVARWRGRLGPLAEQIETVQPPADLWSKIDRATAATVLPQSNVVVLHRRVKVWRGAAAAMTAVAAALAGVLVLQPRAIAPSVVGQAAQGPMVAMLGDDRKQMKVVASWNPGDRQLVLAVAGDMPNDSSHSHELWVIPAGGKPRSLGTMGSARQTHMQLADTIAELMRSGATIAISVEPAGGSRTGAPTGPVVASGSLSRA